MDKKKIGMILFIVGAILLIINLVVIYPFINCSYAPLVFWLLVLVVVIIGLVLYFDVQIFHNEE